MGGVGIGEGGRARAAAIAEAEGGGTEHERIAERDERSRRGEAVEAVLRLPVAGTRFGGWRW